MFDNIRNSIDFFIRNRLRFSRKNYVEKSHIAIERNNLENLYTQAVLEQYFEKSKKNSLKILDIGCKNWFYARGEYNYFDGFCKEFVLDGIEIDAYRLYSNLFSRYETAMYYTKGLDKTNYIVGNLLDLNKTYDYIIWFLPFVLKEPHRMWGLPDKYFYPEKLFKHAYDLLSKGGQMLIINQGEIEADEQKKIIEKFHINYKELGEVKNDFFEYRNKRYGFLIRK